jgi:serine O-acetyltransferase
MQETEFIEILYQKNFSEQRFPNKELLESFAERIFSFLFVPFANRLQSKESVSEEYYNLKNIFIELIVDNNDEASVHRIVKDLFNAIPRIYHELLTDAEAILEYDPAAQSLDEVLVAYPGFYATAIYRIAHQLHIQKVPVLPRLLSEYAHSKTGIDIHPGAKIGKSFFIDHGTGVVIGESTEIGENVKIYQGVTLGAVNVSKEFAKVKRHPTIEDNVTIYSGASILGGHTVVGHDSIIGGNVWLTASVEPYSAVYHNHKVVVRDKFSLAEQLNFII